MSTPLPNAGLPSWKQEGFDAPPVGVSLAGAIVCAVFFFLIALANFANMRRTGYRPFFGMAVACVFRGVSLSLKAASIGAGGISTTNAIMYGFLLNAGFGIAIAIQVITCAGWFKNTTPAANLPPSGRVWWIAVLALFPIVIIFGPIIGLASALMTYIDPTVDRVEVGTQLRKAASGGMLGVVSIALIVVALAIVVAASKAGLWRANGKLAPHAALLFALPALLLLEWSAAYRLATQTTHPELQTYETDFYCLQVLPELLQAMLYVAGPTTRIHLSTNSSQWWTDIGSKNSRKGDASVVPPLPNAGLFDDSIADAPHDLEVSAQPVANATKGERWNSACLHDTPDLEWPTQLRVRIGNLHAYTIPPTWSGRRN